MRNSQRNAPTVNAGSMADIAFLLLIFFLVTTTISADKGILRQLPPDCPPGETCSEVVAERNILNIVVNKENKILVNDTNTTINQLKEIVKAFIDNNGNSTCNYCNGEGLPTASDTPQKAVISLKHHPQTKYNFYIAVQDQLSLAYFELRENYAKHTFNKVIADLSKDEISAAKKAYPFILSEADTYKRN